MRGHVRGEHHVDLYGDLGVTRAADEKEIKVKHLFFEAFNALWRSCQCGDI